jgi:hypothetical protein
VIGGMTFFWLKRSLQGKFYRKAFALLLAGWTMVCAVIIRRMGAVLRGRHPVEKLADV